MITLSPQRTFEVNHSNWNLWLTGKLEQKLELKSFRSKASTRVVIFPWDQPCDAINEVFLLQPPHIFSPRSFPSPAPLWIFFRKHFKSHFLHKPNMKNREVKEARTWGAWRRAGYEISLFQNAASQYLNIKKNNRRGKSRGKSFRSLYVLNLFPSPTAVRSSSRFFPPLSATCWARIHQNIKFCVWNFETFPFAAHLLRLTSSFQFFFLLFCSSRVLNIVEGNRCEKSRTIKIISGDFTVQCFASV